VSISEDGNFLVKDFVVNSPVHFSRKILPKDVIVRIDGKPVNGLGFEEFEDLVFGPVDSAVTLTLRRPVNPKLVKEFSVELLRHRCVPAAAIIAATVLWTHGMITLVQVWCRVRSSRPAAPSH
jgi:C-terminal processing protease CtpA/Prc